ncbi:hemolysin family protein [Botrimarina hoheduenensis]|uniref:Magnesium and cobalt efflux protein CorC n=1 Tax=Botrimarina hoheduenensis TaxID=2528000 RepID=A0A5C5WB63_9BACT|nr:hemolysin family protein [Botrimarina hoheduenensis]TWT47319.1 Magnesium and cobalt efflux protein CorC [Botrimarina hoheduenensis]
MMDDPLAWIAAVSLAFTALASLGACALRAFSRTELQEVCERYDRPQRFTEVLRLRGQTALGIDLLAAIAAGLFVAASVSLVATTPAQRPPAATLLGSGALAGLVLALVRVGAPWTVARVYGAAFVFHTWPLWRALDTVSTPLRATVSVSDAVLHRLAGRNSEPQDAEDVLEEEIRTIVSEGHRGGLLEEDAREMIESVIELGDAKVSQIMTPRTDMHMMPVDLSWSELLSIVIELGHTRIPVYEGSRDEIAGILYVKDLLPELARSSEADRRPLREILRKPIFVPAAKPVDDLLEQFQQERTHIALVLDEYGGVTGLVTIEDVLEEIVGEIVDEYDDAVEEEVRSIGDSAVEAIGRAHIDEINEALGTDIPEDASFDTIAGFVFTELGRVPVVGDQVAWNGAVRVTVLQATRRRIERVRVERFDSQASDES